MNLCMPVSIDSHVDVWRLETSLVDVVEGEGLRGVGAVLVHFHRCPAASLAVGLSLRLLPPRCHDLRQGESHDTGDAGERTSARGVRWGKFSGLSLFFHFRMTSPSLGRGTLTDSNPRWARSRSKLRRKHHLVCLLLSLLCTWEEDRAGTIRVLEKCEPSEVVNRTVWRGNI